MRLYSEVSYLISNYIPQKNTILSILDICYKKRGLFFWYVISIKNYGTYMLSHVRYSTVFLRHSAVAVPSYLRDFSSVLPLSALHGNIEPKWFSARLLKGTLIIINKIGRSTLTLRKISSDLTLIKQFVTSFFAPLLGNK